MYHSICCLQHLTWPFQFTRTLCCMEMVGVARLWKHFWDKNDPFGLHLHGEAPLGHACAEFFVHWSGKGWTSESWQQRSKAGRFTRLVGGVTRSCSCPTAPSVPSRHPLAPGSFLMRDSPSSDSDSQLPLRVIATFWHFCPPLSIFIPTLPPIS